MPRPIPTPVAAAIGLVPAVLGGVRALPGKVLTLPILAVGSALSTLDATRRGYDDLADRGERLVVRLRGTSLDEVVDEVAADVEGATRALRSVAGTGAAASAMPDEPDETPAGTPADETPADEMPKGVATPRASEPDAHRVDTAAPARAVRAAHALTAASGAVLAHDELPLADYDHMTLGSLRGRLRSLDLEQLGQVRAYEKAHADRLPVVTMLDNRIARLLTDAEVTPTAPAQPR